MKCFRESDKKSKDNNRQIPSYYKPLFQSYTKQNAIGIYENDFYSHEKKTHFHDRGFTLSLVLKVRVFGTGKLPIALC